MDIYFRQARMWKLFSAMFASWLARTFRTLVSIITQHNVSASWSDIPGAVVPSTLALAIKDMLRRSEDTVDCSTTASYSGKGYCHSSRWSWLHKNKRIPTCRPWEVNGIELAKYLPEALWNPLLDYFLLSDFHHSSFALTKSEYFRRCHISLIYWCSQSLPASRYPTRHHWYVSHRCLAWHCMTVNTDAARHRRCKYAISLTLVER